MSSLPVRARAVIGVAVAAGLTVLVLATRAQVVAGAPTARQLVVLAVLGVLLAASWVKPLMIYVGDQSEAVHLDEYFFIVLACLTPRPAVLLIFFLATAAAQAIRGRALAKSAFNLGQVLVSCGAAVLVFGPLAGNHSSSWRTMAAGVIGAAVYLVANTGAVAAILVATGQPWRRVLADGLDVRLVFNLGAVAVALTTVQLLLDTPWFLPLAVVPPLILRVVLADQFEARHDRARVHGLFEATLEANHSMGEDEVRTALVRSARELLRCSDAALSEVPADMTAVGTLQARLPLPDRHLWLCVWGRNKGEPFAKGDQALLDALAAVGTGALSNAWLYEEGRYHRERLAAITSSLGEGVCAVTATGEITFVNPAAATMLGWAHNGEPSARDDSHRPRVGQRAPVFLFAPAQRAIASERTVTNHDARFERSDGSSLYVAFTASPIFTDGRATGAVLVFRDISERKEFEEQLARHAFHDVLTGLANRRLFLDHLDHAVRRSERSNERHAVLFADVDRFKIINDSLGHHAGDHLLLAIAERMRQALRPGDVLARFGGDEFTVLLEGVGGPEDAVAAARRILDAMRQPIALPDGHEVVTSLSIGVALTVPGKTGDDLLHDADVAMYQSKGRGSGQYQVFDADAMGARSAERIELETALRLALDSRELEVYYQPLYAIGDRRIVGAEALVRWNHPERGLLGPSAFIALAEESGLILRLGHQVLVQACRQARRWREAFGEQLVVGVNLSARQFQQSALIDEIEDVLSSTGVDPSQLCIEITESLAMDDMERTRQILLSLKELGVRVAIDDFGTGYSALGYLTQFPIDVVKVDRSFIEGVEDDPVKSAIVSAVIHLSEAIGTTAVVEGVETEAQLRHLELLGCPEAQGFHLAKPMPAGRFERLLAAEVVGGTHGSGVTLSVVNGG